MSGMQQIEYRCSEMNASQSAFGGRSSSLLILLNVMCFGVAITASKWITADREKPVTEMAVHIFLIALIWIGCVCIVMFFCKARDTAFLVFSQPVTARNNLGFLKTYLPRIGLYLFAVGSIALDGLELAGEIQCFQVSSVSHMKDEAIVALVFYISKIVFCTLQLEFLRRFAEGRCKTYIMRVTVLIILAANISTWFYVFLSESSELFPTSRNAIPWLNLSDASLHDTSHKILIECMYHNTTLQTFIENLEPYIYPFTMEYSLLAAGILCHIWSEEGHPESHRGADLETQGHEKQVQLNKSDERSPLLNTRPRGRKWMCCLNAFTVGLVMTVVLLIIEGLLIDEELHEDLMIVFYWARCVYYLCLLFVAALGLRETFKHEIQTSPYSPEDILLLVSATGEFLYLYFGLTATAAVMSSSEEETTKPALLTTTNILDLIEIALQTSILICGRRFAEQFNTETYCLRECLSFLAICNFGKWGTDSFLEGRFLGISPTQTEYFGSNSWILITRVTYPLCIFYRFHSVIVILEIISELPQNKTR